MNMGTIKTIALATGFAVAGALAASAATITVDNTPALDTTAPTALPASAFFDPAHKPYTSKGGDIAKISKSPFGDTTTDYFFVDGRERTPKYPANSPAVLLLKSAKGALSLLWGSPDSYNELSFYLKGALQYSFNGSVDVNGGTPLNNGPTSFVTVSDLKFDEVRFFSNGDNAFEFANVDVAAIPVPAAGLMLLSAIGGLAAARRRKQA